MTDTERLLEQAKWEIEHLEEVVLMPTYRKLIHKFEMAYHDLDWVRACKTCKFANKLLTDTECANCTGQRWQWWGDE